MNRLIIERYTVLTSDAVVEQNTKE